MRWQRCSLTSPTMACPPPMYAPHPASHINHKPTALDSFLLHHEASGPTSPSVKSHSTSIAFPPNARGSKFHCCCSNLMSCIGATAQASHWPAPSEQRASLPLCNMEKLIPCFDFTYGFESEINFDAGRRRRERRSTQRTRR